MPFIADLPPQPPTVNCVREIGEAFGFEGRILRDAAKEAADHLEKTAEWLLAQHREFEDALSPEHMAFLKRVSTESDPPLITHHVAEVAREAWVTIQIVSGGTMQLPAASAGPDGIVAYSWDNGPYHLELEIIPDQPSVFFYRNRDTEDIWEVEYNFQKPGEFPSVVQECLGFFVSHP